VSGSFTDLVNQSIDRTRESVLSILGIYDVGLRTHLSQQMHKEFGKEGCFLAPPVFEHTYGWEPGNVTLADLAGGLLSRELVDALANAENPDYRFPKNVMPYKHQIHSWEVLLDSTPKSTVITTGTGSGKTECFMVPILQDLLQEYTTEQSPLIGVRALFLYPLNALINSQRERLHAWTKPFGNNVRFCLYNGNTPEKATKVRKLQSELPNQILSRELLRNEPAPILMTNATMLEYMLVRQVDNPILEKSKKTGSLRWIVLDEAHTYIGSQAAELSLLLRRVVEAFGKRAEEIRFIATSATIADPNARESLQSYLASLAGVPESQVIVIGGNRAVPILGNHVPQTSSTYEDIVLIDQGKEVSEKRFAALASNETSRTLRDQIVEANAPRTLNELVDHVKSSLTTIDKMEQQDEVIRWLDLMTSTKINNEDPPFIKLRMHLFQRMLHGLWGCIDYNCSAKTSLIKDWPFGNIYLTQRIHCNCGAPVYEIAFCDDCKQPHLIAEDRSGFLHQSTPYSGDEFSLLEDGDDEYSETETPTVSKQKVVIGTKESDTFHMINFDLNSRALGLTEGGHLISLNICPEEFSNCNSCGYVSNQGPGAFLRKAYLGAPFFVSQAVPTVLEFCPKPSKKDLQGTSPESMPGEGKKLITFTDSRQGTARMAVRMQQEAERSRLRGMVFQALRNLQSAKNLESSDVPTASPEEIDKQADNLDSMGMKDMAQSLRKQAEAIRDNSKFKAQVMISWPEMIEELAKSNDLKHSILDYNKYANPHFFGGDAGSKTLARLLLMREFSRRPKNQNSSETLALVKVGYRGLDNINTVPQFWGQRRVSKSSNSAETEFLSLHDWKDFLKVSLDFYVRENTIIRLGREEQNWMGAKFAPKLLFGPDYQHGDTRSRAWPTIQKNGQYSRLIKILSVGAELNPDNSADRDLINTWLRAAWTALINAQILQSYDNGYALSHQALVFSLPNQAWVCPVTNRLIDTTFRAYTPYLPRVIIAEKYRCKKVELPDFNELAPAGESEGILKSIRKKVANNPQIQILRQQGLWTDISDRTVEGGFYYRTAEHSAQQSAERLKLYEKDFQEGRINVLNCSTTMEMGVDIGGVSSVVMNNVPPHPANYLQRAGRAGRRSEARAIAYTLCKPDPHNTRVFLNPKWPFVTSIPAPTITLSAAPLVQRHVNSFLLANFLCNVISTEDEDRTRLTVQWFFGGEDSHSQQFIDWLSDKSKLPESGLKNIIKGTALESKSRAVMLDETRQKIDQLAKVWREDYERLNQRVEMALDPAYKKAMELERKRHEQEYLLRDLAARTFLPGYGFPTDVVSLSTYNVEDFIERQNFHESSSRDDNIFQYKDKPSRDMSIAIREYAPGAQVVLDGRVYRSAGVELQAYQSGANGVQKFDIAWRCQRCGTHGYKEYAYLNEDGLECYECHATIPFSETKRILRPAGFVTDFYESTTNDVSSQKFIPVNPPRISLEGTTISLPDERCGFIRFGEDGHVFHHSSGENQTGYAICMSCGRAESMTINGELPTRLRPDKEHRPIGGQIGSNREHNCSGEKVMPNLHLGYQTATHVLEIALKNPLTGEWLPITETGKAISNTLAVALRDSIAERLGIVSTEMGFGTRQEKDLQSGRNRLLIQVYDNVAGGAGFVLTGLENLTQILFRTFEKLECRAQCENVCSSCLAGQDSRVEFHELDRKAALDWVNAVKIKDYLKLPEPFDSIPGAQYWAYEPKRFLRHWINKGLKAIILPIVGQTENWDLTDPVFRNELIAWKLIEDLEITIVIDEAAKLDNELKDALSLYEKVGILLAEANFISKTQEIVVATQVVTRTGNTISLLTNDTDALEPGKNWFSSKPSSLWIFSKKFPDIELNLLKTSGWQQTPVGAEVIEVKSELNVPLPKLADSIKDLFENKAPRFAELINKDKVVSIHYQDRYLKSPWNVMVLMAILEAFRSEKTKNIVLETVNDKTNNHARLLWHNWPDMQDMQKMTATWIQLRYKLNPEIKIHQQNSELTHRRILTLEFSSGDKWKLAFDQGMGYWEASSFNRTNNVFDFNQEAEEQLKSILNIWPNMKLSNIGDWPTDISIYR
jgi:DEAD/DEAH box helicase domain-containing protein